MIRGIIIKARLKLQHLTLSEIRFCPCLRLLLQELGYKLPTSTARRALERSLSALEDEALPDTEEDLAEYPEEDEGLEYDEEAEDANEDEQALQAQVRTLQRQNSERAARAPPAPRGRGTALSAGPAPRDHARAVGHARERAIVPRPKPGDTRPYRAAPAERLRAPAATGAGRARDGVRPPADDPPRSESPEIINRGPPRGG